jgi:hypothetical protein
MRVIAQHRVTELSYNTTTTNAGAANDEEHRMTAAEKEKRVGSKNTTLVLYIVSFFAVDGVFQPRIVPHLFCKYVQTLRV